MTLPGPLDRAVEAACGRRPTEVRRLGGGCVGEVARVTFGDGDALVAKWDPAVASGLDVEARMLRELAVRTALPVPRVVHAAPELLLLELLPGATGCRGSAEEHLADLIAELHAVHGERFGLDYDTRIGGLVQPNGQDASWLRFFAEQRLVHFARLAESRGRLAARTRRHVEQLAARLDVWLDEPAHPALLHGDLWSGNVLSADGRITGLLDPAIHHGHPEVELAFATLFGTVGERFFARYREHRGGPDRAFFTERRDLYNVYPLLVHTVLFGGGYADDVQRTVERFT
ncbi:MAG: fructosamine kinase family protein [Planctomycetes bacterium]|nr:fructosamine kinase family protein [Planctomycetota bacterium]